MREHGVPLTFDRVLGLLPRRSDRGLLMMKTISKILIVSQPTYTAPGNCPIYTFC